MRIAFFHVPSDHYGASRSLIRLTSRLKNEHHDVFVILANDGPLKQLLVSNGINVVIHKSLAYYSRAKLKSFLGILAFVFNIPISVFYLIQFAKSQQIEIFHTNIALIISPGIVSKLLGLKHFWHIRESFSEFGILWNIYKWFIYFFSTKIICVSGPIAAQFENKKILRRTTVLHNGFPLEEFSNTNDQSILYFKRDYGITDEITIGVLGRIKFRRKGQDVFVKAGAILIEKYKNLRFFIIGSPFPDNESHAKMLIDLIEKYNLQRYFILTGDIPDTKIAYCALDIVVLPSVTPEPFGGVVVEAMGFKKPVVGTKIGGTIEQIEDNVTGFLVHPDDPVDLALALEKLILNKSLRENFGQLAYDRFLKRFEFEIFYTKLLTIYEIN